MFVLVDGKVRYEIDKPVFMGNVGTGTPNYNPTIIFKPDSLAHTLEFDTTEHYGCGCKYAIDIILPQKSVYEDHEIYSTHLMSNHEEWGLFLCPKCGFGHDPKYSYKLECACGVILLKGHKFLYMWD